MDSPAGVKVLRQPALLYLILSHLSQEDLLLRVQRVCKTWNEVISSDSRLMAIMWLHPGPPTARVDDDDATTEINPLLQKTAEQFFSTGCFRDLFAPEPELAPLVDGRSPFVAVWMSLSRRRRGSEYWNCPSASWRRMLPCSPAPDQLLVNISGEEVEQGKLLSLNFSNRGMPDTIQPSHPLWLTFGLLYDITENAWQQGSPFHLHELRFDFCRALPNTVFRLDKDFVPQAAIISDELRASAQSRVRCVRVHLNPDTRSSAERRKAHDKAYEAYARNARRVAKVALCGRGRRGPWPDRIYTDEFHIAGALSLDEIEWDETHEYGMPPRETPQPATQPDPPPKRRFLGFKLWSKKE